jgi:hypothetical protein
MKDIPQERMPSAVMGPGILNIARAGYLAPESWFSLVDG